MKRLCLLLVLILTFSLAACGSTASAPQSASQPAAQADVSASPEEAPLPQDEAPETQGEESVTAAEGPAPEAEYLEDFTVRTIDGGTFTLSEELADHKLVLINLWATWCEPCQTEFPYLQEAWQERSDEISLVALSVEPSDNLDVLDSYAARLGLSIPMGSVEETGLDRFARYAIPTTVVVDHTGRVLAAETGAKFSVQEVYQLFDRFTSEDFDPDVCSYTVFTCDLSIQPLEGVELAFVTDVSRATAVSGPDGNAVFTGPPARYRVEVVSAPENMIPFSTAEVRTDPYPQALTIYFERGYVPREGADEEFEYAHEGPDPDWIILDDFTVDTADGGTFTLSEALKDHTRLLIHLFDADSDNNAWAFSSLQKVSAQRGDTVAVLALSVEPSDSLEKLKDYTDELGVSFPVGREEGTGLDSFAADGLPATVLVDSKGRVAYVEKTPLNTAESVHSLLDRFSGQNYNPYECTYYIFTYYSNAEGVVDAVFNFCTDESCTPVATDENGTVTFVAPPGKYHVQLVSSPKGAKITVPDEWYTEPYPQVFWAPFEK